MNRFLQVLLAAGLCCFMAINALAQTFTAATSNTTTVCAGNQVTIAYNASANFGAGNQIIVELSNAAGSFAAATVLNTASTIAATNSYNVTIPAATTGGNFYRIRVRSTNPANTLIVGTIFTIVGAAQCSCPADMKVDWQVSYGGSQTDNFSVVLPTADGGYLLGGHSLSNINTGNKTSPNYLGNDYWVVKVDAAGNKLWDSSYGGNQNDNLFKIIPTPDGGYLLCGSSQSDANTGNKTAARYGVASLDYWVVKINANGVKQWDQSYGGTEAQLILDIVPTADGNYLIGGGSNSPSNGTKTAPLRGEFDYWVVKMDANGNQLWDSSYGGTNNDQLRSMVATPDGGFLLAGRSSSLVGGTKTVAPNVGGVFDYYVVKMNADGQQIWDNRYGGTAADNLSHIIPATDGGYLLVGHSASFPSGQKTAPKLGTNDIWVVKIDGSGTQLWDSTYGGNVAETNTSIMPSRDGGFYVAAQSTSGATGNKTIGSFGNNDLWVLKIDGNGVITEQYAYGSSADDRLNNNQQIWPTADGGFIVGGTSAGGLTGNKEVNTNGGDDYWVLKVSPNIQLAASARTTTICAGETLNIDYSTSCGTFNAGNNILIELSNTVGSFASPTLLNTAATTAASGNYNVTIPAATAGGEIYKIRVISTNPVDTAVIGSIFTIVPPEKCNCTNDLTSIWQRSFGGGQQDDVQQVLPTADGGYLFAGISLSSSGGNKTAPFYGIQDIWLVKTDASGNMQWDSSYGGNQSESINAIVHAQDGGYLFGGSSRTTTLATGNLTALSFGLDDFWLVKTDENGVIQWQRNYGGTSNDELRSIVPTSDGGYLLGGTSLSGITGNKTTVNIGNADYWLVKIDVNGNIEWDKTYGGTLADNLRSVVPLSDGGFLLAGHSNSGISGLKSEIRNGPTNGQNDFWIVKIDANGNFIWDKTIGGTGNDLLAQALLLNDGNILLIGESGSSTATGVKTAPFYGGIDTWAVKIDQSGNILWDKAYGGAVTDLPFSASPLANGQVMISVTSNSPPDPDPTVSTKTLPNFGTGNDVWLVLIDNDGNQVKDYVYGAPGGDNGRRVFPTSDGGVIMLSQSTTIIGGNKTVNSNGQNDMWIVKLGGNVQLSATARTTTVCAGESLTIDYANIGCSNFNAGNNIRIELSNAAGSFASPTLLNTAATTANSGNYSVTIPSATPGGEFYRIRVISTNLVDTVLIGSPFTIVPPAFCNCSNDLISIWQRSFGGTALEDAQVILPTPDGGYLFGGSSASVPGGNKTSPQYGVHFWLVKTDALGNIQWDSSYGGADIELLRSMVVAQDGGYLLGGDAATPTVSGNLNTPIFGSSAQPDYWVVKIDDNGVIQWQQNYGANNRDILYQIIPHPAGGYLLAGESSVLGGGNRTATSFGSVDYWLVRIDVNGNIIWDKTFGGAAVDILFSAIPTADGGFLLAGESTSDISGLKSQNRNSSLTNNADFWVVKIDAEGNFLWDRTFGGTTREFFKKIISLNDGNFLLIGTSNSASTTGQKTAPAYGGFDVWVVKIDASGNMLWDNSYGGSGSEEVFSAIQLANGEIVIGASSNSPISGNKTLAGAGLNDVWLVSIDENGGKIKESIWGGTVNDFSRAILPTADGGILFTSRSQSAVNGNKTINTNGLEDYWGVKLGGNVQLSATARTTTVCAGESLTIDYANTGCGNFNAGNNIRIELSNAAGSFASPVLLNTAATTANSGNYSVTIPSGTPGGESYRIRVISTNLVDTIVIGKPITIVSLSLCNCPNGLDIKWQKVYGGTDLERFQYILPTRDGGYLYGGNSASGADGNKASLDKGLQDYWIVKTDADGNIIWDSTYGGSADDQLTSIIQTSEGGYLFGGTSNSPAGTGNKSAPLYANIDYWVVKIDADGVKQWDQSYGGSGIDILNVITATADGGFLLGGHSDSPTDGTKTATRYGTSKDYWIVKIDANGNQIWDKVYGGNRTDEAYDISPSADGGFLIGGQSNSLSSDTKTSDNNSGTNNDYWVIKIDNDGNPIWDNVYGGTGVDAFRSILPHSDGGFILAGYSNSPISAQKSAENKGASDFWVVKIDATGVLLWDSTYGGSGNDNLSSTVSNKSGGFFLSGISASGISGNKTIATFGNFDYWVVEINADGIKINEYNFGSASNAETQRGLHATSEGGFLIGGNTSAGISGNKTEPAIGNADYWVLKLGGKVQLSAIARTTTVCAGESLTIDYANIGCGSFNAGNNIRIELSNAAGSFTSPTLLNTAATMANSGNYSVAIPSATPGGELYKIRVISTNPVDTAFIGDIFSIVPPERCNCTGDLVSIWQRSFGGTTTDQPQITLPTADGGYLSGGLSFSGVSGNKDAPLYGDRTMWIVKTDGLGNKQWDSSYGANDIQQLSTMVNAPDGGYLLAGFTTATNPTIGNQTTPSCGLSDFWVVKINANGIIQWQNTYGSTSNEFLSSAIATPDGGYLLGGFASGVPNCNRTASVVGNTDYWVVKIDANGNAEWDQAYGGSGADALRSMLVMPDGGYLLVGNSSSMASGIKTEDRIGPTTANNDFWIIKIDANGDYVWDKTIGGTGNDIPVSAISLADGNILLLGQSSSGQNTGLKTAPFYGGTNDIWAVKIDPFGDIIWNNAYGGAAEDVPFSVAPLANGQLIISGTSNSAPNPDPTLSTKTLPNFGTGNDVWLVMIDENGQQVKDYVFGASGNDEARRVLPTGDGGVLLLAQSVTDVGGNKTVSTNGSFDYWLVKLGGNVQLSASARTTTVCAGNTITVDYANTGCGSFNAGNNIRIELSNAAGSFASPVLLNTAATTANSGNYSVTIPAATVGGEFYKIRVISSNPVDTVVIGNLLTVVSEEKCNCPDDFVIEWQISQGGTGFDQLNIVLPTADGGYLLGGTAATTVTPTGTKTFGGYGSFDYWIVKLDANGDKLWDSSYGGAENEFLRSVIPTLDGGFLLGGYSISNAISGNKTATAFGLDDYWVVKINANGIIQWDRSYGGNQRETLSSMLPTNDGGFLLLGDSRSGSNGSKTAANYGNEDYWVVKIDANGNQLWDQSYGGSDLDLSPKVIASSDGGFLLAGYSRSPVSGSKTSTNYGNDDYWVVKIDNNGNQLWDNTYGGTGADVLNIIAPTADGGFLLAGQSTSGANGNKTAGNFGFIDYWVVKINAGGTPVWDYAYGGSEGDFPNALNPAKDGGFFLAGTSNSPANGNKTIPTTGNNDYWVVKIDVNGIKTKEYGFGGTAVDIAASLVPTADGGFLVAGYSNSGINGNKTVPTNGDRDYWLLKLAPMPEITPVDISASAFCSGDSIDIEFDITNCGSFNSANIFTYQLSDTLGSFATPTILGTAPNTTTRDTTLALPLSLPTGSGYRIRIVASIPSVISDTSAAFSIAGTPDLSAGISVSCTNGLVISVPDQGSGVTYQWQNSLVNIPTATNRELAPVVQGTYRIIASRGTCRDTAGTYSLTYAAASKDQIVTLPDGSDRLICDAATQQVMMRIDDVADGNVHANTSTNMYVVASAPVYNGQPYVRRYWDVTPTIPRNKPARLTFYVPQADFDNFNANRLWTPALPTGPGDAAGIDQLVVSVFHGFSPTNLPATYDGPAEYRLSGVSVDVVWNAAISLWEISLDVAAFSGFFIHTLPRVLPVTLVSFTGSFQPDIPAVALNWETSSEFNCDYFEVQKLQLDGTYKPIGTVGCSGNSNEPRFYSFLDPNYNIGSNIYRLRQVDYDGSFELSRSIDIPVGAKSGFSFKAWTDQVFLYAEATERGMIEVLDVKGSLIQKMQIEAGQRLQIFAANLAKGMYLMRFVNEDRQQAEKVVMY
jgi:hypothetical protein